MVHLMKLKKNEMPRGWKIKRESKDGIDYKSVFASVSVRKDGSHYWFDWSTKGGNVISSTFVKDKNKIKPTLKKIMNKEFTLRRD